MQSQSDVSNINHKVWRDCAYQLSQSDLEFQQNYTSSSPSPSSSKDSSNDNNNNNNSSNEEK